MELVALTPVLNLSRGKFYRIIDENEKDYLVVNDSKQKEWFPKYYFGLFEDMALSFDERYQKYKNEIVRARVEKPVDLEALSEEFRKSLESIKPLSIKKDQAENNGGSTDYYKFDPSWKELADVIEAKEMGYNIANCFKACFRLGGPHHSSKVRDLNKIIYFAQRELQIALKKEKQNG